MSLFKNSHPDLVSKEARIRASKKMIRDKHPNWKGGKPKCISCGKILSAYGAKRCRKCYVKWSQLNTPRKGVHIQTNTGRTHFKKGLTPWNKGKKMPYTDKRKAYDERQKGKYKPKPIDFSETMRKVNPPKGKKMKYNSRESSKRTRVWRGGYVMIYKPNYPFSKKKSPDFGYILEHRYILGKYLGRQIQSPEVIHHLDGKKSNNKIENLLLCENNKEHNHVHTAMEIFVEKLIREERVEYDNKTKRFRFR